MNINFLKNITTTICIVFLMSPAAPAAAGRTQITRAGVLDAGRVFWKTLCFKAGNFFVNLRTDVGFKISTAQKIEKELIPTPEATALQASGPETFEITVRSVIKPLLGTIETIQSKAWCDPENNAVLQHIRTRHGKKNWRKIYRFTDRGVLRLKKIPGPSDPEDKPDLSMPSRTDIKKDFYPYELKKTGCTSVLEPSELFAIISMPDFSIGSESTFCVFSKKGLYFLDIRVMELKRLKTDYIERSGKNKIRKSGYTDCIKILFNPRSAAGKHQESRDFSFLGISGDFEIVIDKKSRIPILVSGNVPGFGKTDFHLSEVELK